MILVMQNSILLDPQSAGKISIFSAQTLTRIKISVLFNYFVQNPRNPRRGITMHCAHGLCYHYHIELYYTLLGKCNGFASGMTEGMSRHAEE